MTRGGRTPTSNTLETKEEFAERDDEPPRVIQNWGRASRQSIVEWLKSDNPSRRTALADSTKESRLRDPNRWTEGPRGRKCG
jgi:hypothetical protein